jgi:hypothetical protein
MEWDEIQKLDFEWIDSIWQEARPEVFYEAFINSRDLTEWAQYLEANPPSPEVLAIALTLGLEKFQSRSGRLAGLKSGVARRETVRCTPEAVAKEYQTLMATGTEERNIAAKLATRFKVTSNHIRKLRKQANNQT